MKDPNLSSFNGSTVLVLYLFRSVSLLYFTARIKPEVMEKKLYSRRANCPLDKSVYRVNTDKQTLMCLCSWGDYFQHTSCVSFQLFSNLQFMSLTILTLHTNNPAMYITPEKISSEIRVSKLVKIKIVTSSQAETGAFVVLMFLLPALSRWHMSFRVPV